MFLREFFTCDLSVIGIPLLSSREISNACSNEIVSMTEPSINSLFTLFAQFIGHDLSSAANDKDDESKQINCQCQEKIKNPFYMNIPTSNIFDQI